MAAAEEHGYRLVLSPRTATHSERAAIATALGHRRLAHVDGGQDEIAMARRAGFAAGVRRHRLRAVDLTTVRQEAGEFARLAVGAAVERLDRGRLEPKLWILEPELVVRGSTGAVSDPARCTE